MAEELELKPGEESKVEKEEGAGEAEDKDKDKDVVTLGKLAAYAETGVLTAFTAVDFKASTAILVGKFSRFAQDELRERNEMRKTLAKKYGKRIDDENGEAWQVLPPSQSGDADKWTKFRAELIDLDDAEVDLSRFNFRPTDLRTVGGKEAIISGIVVQMLLDLGIFKE